MMLRIAATALLCGVFSLFAAPACGEAAAPSSGEPHDHEGQVDAEGLRETTFRFGGNDLFVLPARTKAVDVQYGRATGQMSAEVSGDGWRIILFPGLKGGMYSIMSDEREWLAAAESLMNTGVSRKDTDAARARVEADVRTWTELQTDKKVLECAIHAQRAQANDESHIEQLTWIVLKKTADLALRPEDALLLDRPDGSSVLAAIRSGPRKNEWNASLGWYRNDGSTLILGAASVVAESAKDAKAILSRVLIGS